VSGFEHLKLRDVMVDLETLGQSPGCAILSIGAVAFKAEDFATDPGVSGVTGERFYRVINTKSCRALGLREEAGTIAWWDKQSPEARAVLTEAETGGIPLKQALTEFASFLRDHGGQTAVRLWGNGADFDNAIIAYLYNLLGEPVPWSFWNNRCFRTLKNLAPDVKPGTAPGGKIRVAHNALDDAASQASHAIAILFTLSQRRVLANLPRTEA
jgi:hypothetical protein